MPKWKCAFIIFALINLFSCKVHNYTPLVSDLLIIEPAKNICLAKETYNPRLDEVDLDHKTIETASLDNNKPNKASCLIIERKAVENVKSFSSTPKQQGFKKLPVRVVQQAKVKNATTGDGIYFLAFVVAILAGVILLGLSILTGIYTLQLIGTIILLGILFVALSILIYRKAGSEALRLYFGRSALSAFVLGAITGILFLSIYIVLSTLLELFIVAILSIFLLTAAAILFGSGLAWLLITIVEN